ncbi:anthranilate phosphoribosyltransferase [Fluviispira multicolorata]|uniref:Anthranilate phosphoribosyltransferase n=1 Tax=Fluviispira multicolorata TaxID=2654512 RepID=A0A833JFT3_9BACT|nr:anthranilate phosphoribosyltransferase [Fluviispira multicolorata]KAB8031781.1 anthranilate phosphoribosyltransferase [Fluviispira multicolorata]
MIIDKNFSPIMEQVFAGRGFSKDETEALVHSMIDGTLSEVRVAAVLTGFRFITLTEEIIIAILSAIREKNPVTESNSLENVVDCGGTGGDHTSTVNISTTAAIVAAGAGANVAKFAGKSISSKSGSSDVLKMLDLTPANSLKDACDNIKKYNIAFLPSNSYYPNLKHLAHIRKTLGFKTIVDLVYPLANPIKLTGQLVGVYSKDSLPLIINCLKKLGRRRAIVAHGEDGLDEISVCSATYISKLENGKITHEVLKPTELGFKIHKIKDLVGKDIEYNTKVLIDVLKNDAHPAVMDAVTINSAATLWCAEKCNSISEGIELAKLSITSGNALSTLEKWKNHK